MTSLLVEDLLEDVHWTNIQDPIKQMLIALTKAIRTQSSGMKDLDRKMGYLSSKESTERLVNESMARMCSKDEAVDIMKYIESKADGVLVNLLESKLSKLTEHMTKLGEIVQRQSNNITDINIRLDRACNDIEELKRPNYDHIFSYIDRQMNGLSSDIDRKLALKADSQVVERVLPARVEDIIRNFNVQLADMKIELGRTASKEEFHRLATQKADNDQLRELSAELTERVTRQDLQQTVTQQVKPVVVALSSLERAVQIQQSSQAKETSIMQQHISDVIRLQNQHIQQRQNQPLSEVEKEAVTQVVENALQDRGWGPGETFPLGLQNTLAAHSDSLLGEIRQLSDALRQEISGAQIAVSNACNKRVDDQALELAEAIKATKDGSLKTRASLKELAVNVTKALSKKLDRNDLRKVLKEKEEEEQVRRRNRQEEDGTSSENEVPNRSRSSRSASAPRHTQGKRRSEFDTILADWREEGLNAQGGSSSSSSSRHTNQRSELSSSRRARSGSPTSRSTTSQGSNGAVAEAVAAELTNLRSSLLAVNQELNAIKAATDVTLIKELQRSIAEMKGQLAARSSSGGAGNSSTAAVLSADWRLALGELSLNLRRELSDKTGREEMYSTIRQESDLLEKRLTSVTKKVDSSASAEEVSQIQNELSALKSKVAGELTGARWLWTTGQVVKDGWIPWDTQVINAAPAVLQWKRGSTSIVVRMPGLYRICVAVFTFLPLAVQVCLSGEPLLSLQPASAGDSQSPFVNAQAMKDDKYVLRRLRHSAGEVSCVCIDEHVSLPPEAELSVRFHSAAAAQAFFSIRKI